MTEKLLKLDAKIVFILYILIEIICVGMGMGIPIFCILFGFPLGWCIVKRICTSMENSHLGIFYTLSRLIIHKIFNSILFDDCLHKDDEIISERLNVLYGLLKEIKKA